MERIKEKAANKMIKRNGMEFENALDNDTLKEILEYIARMHDIDLKPIEK